MNGANRLTLDDLRAAWRAAWPAALGAWSRYVQLHEPQWCFTEADEKREKLSGSFAMIRLFDHAIVISLRLIQQENLDQFAREILAHEIGHHVYCPADLTDNARLLARIRYGLPGKEHHGPMVSNLYSDLLINDRLQRSEELDIAGVYRQLGSECRESLWTLYMRIYEMLWKLPTGTLAKGECDARLNQDAQLGARLIRSYAREWLGGAGRFAALCLPYILKDDEQKPSRGYVVWNDTRGAGYGGIPDGLTVIDGDEITGAVHPAEDPELSGIEGLGSSAVGTVPGELSGQKTTNTYRQPYEFGELLKALGLDLPGADVTARYYRELAQPHLIPFPTPRLPQSLDPLPENWEVWDVDSPLENIDWLGTFLTSPHVVPGVTTRERFYGGSPGKESAPLPVDLYLGIDCSGSMGDPGHRLSYPVLAGAIIAISALRAGSQVKVVLSGEPGKTVSTDGFLRNQSEVLRTMVSYLGTGYSFGIHRLSETFHAECKLPRPVHILILSDHDMFSMLDERGQGRIGWDVARESLERCGGQGTFVLQLPSQGGGRGHRHLDRLRNEGWRVSLVDSLEELVVFARDFSRLTFEDARIKP